MMVERGPSVSASSIAFRRSDHDVFCRFGRVIEESAVCIVDETAQVVREAKVVSGPVAIDDYLVGTELYEKINLPCASGSPPVPRLDPFFGLAVRCRRHTVLDAGVWVGLLRSFDIEAFQQQSGAVENAILGESRGDTGRFQADLRVEVRVLVVEQIEQRAVAHLELLGIRILEPARAGQLILQTGIAAPLL